MKYIKQIALAALLMASSTGTAFAEEHEFNTPDISGKLNTMVEVKMDKLVRKTYMYRGHVHVAEYANIEESQVPGSCGEEMSYDSEQTSS